MFVSVLSLRSFSFLSLSCYRDPRTLSLYASQWKASKDRKDFNPSFLHLSRLKEFFHYSPQRCEKIALSHWLTGHLLARRTCSTSVTMASQRRRWADERYGKRSGTNSLTIVRQRPARGWRKLGKVSARSRKGQNEGRGGRRSFGTVCRHGNVLNLLDAFWLRQIRGGQSDFCNRWFERLHGNSK